ncbi:MAG TPA: LytTR family DNA-binding domain-containing protein [Vicinamibacteria bacterium]|nr:LytTR family DNA-binding domain-containing protein [Vicinamibacteria bacterium]
MTTRLRVVLADDERPARAVLAEMIEAGSEAEVVGEAETGPEAVSVIERLRPDLALLDLEMPEMDGLEVARVVRSERMPLLAFVTAYDEYAVRAFEVNAVDYLLKPVAPERLLETFRRVRGRLANPGWREDQLAHLTVAIDEYERARARYLDRLPVRRNDDILMVPTEHLVSAVADGELLHLTTVRNEKHVISYRLKDLEARLDPSRFVRLSRGILANTRMIVRFSPMPGGTYLAIMTNGQELAVSRSQARILRGTLMRL